MAKALVVWLLVGTCVSIARPQMSREDPEPMPSLTVQMALDEVARFRKAEQMERALQANEQARAVAHGEHDAVGEARAEESRALILGSLGRTREAAEAWRATADAWERVGDGPGRVEALAQAGLLLMPGRLVDAEKLFAEAVFLSRAESKRPLAAARALDAAGRRSYDRKYLGSARELWTEALRLRNKLDPGSIGLADALQNMGSVTYQQNDLVAAENYYRQALALRERLAPNSPDVAVSLRALGNVARREGELATAAEYYQQALTLQQKLDPHSLGVAASLTDLGNVAYDQGDPAKAGELYKQALAIRQELAPNSLAIAESLHKLGDVAGHQNDWVAAGEYYRQSLAIQEKLSPDSLEVARNLNSLGYAARRLGDPEKEKQYYQQSLVLREKLVPNSLMVAQSLNELGNVALQQGDAARAVQYHQQALALREKLAPDSLIVADSLRKLGDIAADQGDWKSAEEYHERALALRRKLAPNSLMVATALGSIGNVARAQGDLAKATQYHRQELSLRQKLAPDSLLVAQSQYDLSVLLAKQQNQVEAERLARGAWDLARRQAAIITGDEARRVFDEWTSRYATQLIRCQLALGRVEPAFATLEESRAQSLQQLILDRQVIPNVAEQNRWESYQSAVALRDRREHSLSQASAAEARAREELSTRQAEKADPDLIGETKTELSRATKKLQEAQSDYTRARVRVDELWAEIKKGAPRDFASPLMFDEAWRVLPPGSLFVAFSTSEDQTLLFLLRAADRDREPRLAAHTIKIKRRDLDALVNKLRDHIAQPQNLGDAITASRALFDTIFPAAARVALKASSRLIISPDGTLWEAPFAALVTNPEGPPAYLGRDKAITYAQSLALFAQSRHDPPRLAKGRKVTALVVGNPVFHHRAVTSAVPKGSLSPQRRSYLCFGENKPPIPLPGTEIEALKVAALYRSAALVGEEATEAALRTRIPTADVVHLATHGCTDPARAMSSGLILTAPSQESERGATDNDGVLQAWEIHNQLKLRAELVVLSACDTGRGQAVRGEGLIGLTRALQYAGARSVVASLWTADDQSTLTLMVALHRNLRSGLPKDEALRRAMATVREDPASAHPYYWAAFYLTGDPDNPTLGEEDETGQATLPPASPRLLTPGMTRDSSGLSCAEAVERRLSC